MNTQSFFKSVIALFSETIWLYFGLVILATIEWGILELPQPQGWFLACIAGYGSQLFLRKWNTRLAFLYSISVSLLVALIIYNWQWAAPLGHGYGLAVVLSAIFLFFRSSYFAYKEPTRAQMLLRFEGNIIWYILFVLMLPVNPAIGKVIHLPFMLGIMSSLMGMILTLYSENSAEDQVKTKIVGDKTPGLMRVMIAVLGLGSMISLIILWDPVRKTVILLLHQIGEGAIKFWQLVLVVFHWLFLLLPVSEEDSQLPPQPVQPPLHGEEGQALGSLPFSTFWFVAIAAGVVILIFLWLLPKMKKIKIPSRTRSTVTMYKSEKSFWNWLFQLLLNRFQNLFNRLISKFPVFYDFRIYWYFQLLQRWGERNGMPRFPQETPSEYGKRLTENLPIPQDHIYGDLHVNLQLAILKLGSCFATAYYSGGKEGNIQDFSPLLVYMKKHKIIFKRP